LVLGSQPQNYFGVESNKNFIPSKPQNVLGMNNKSAKELNHIQKLKNNEMLNFSDDEDDEYFDNYNQGKIVSSKDYHRKMENTNQKLKNFSSMQQY